MKRQTSGMTGMTRTEWTGTEGADPDGLCPVVSPTRWPPVAPASYDAIVVGAALPGASIARQLAARSGQRVLVADSAPTLADAHPLVQRLLDHPGIELLLGVDPHAVCALYPHSHAIFTGRGQMGPGGSGFGQAG